MDLSIIVVNWNSNAFLTECLASVYRHIQELSFEIIIVDNASPEGDVESLKKLYPDIITIQSKVNLGFAGANNLGFKSSRGDYALFLNPDTVLTVGAVDTMLKEAKLLADSGIVGCKLLNTDLTLQTSCIQTFPTISNQLLDNRYLQLRWPNCWLWNLGPLYSKNTQPVAVEVISGACMLMKRDVFAAAGMFSEDYFMYAEDLDLCYKVSRLGLKNYYVGDAEIIHHGGKSSSQNKVNQWATLMKFRSVQRFCTKTHGAFYGATFKAAMGCVALGRVMILALLRPFGDASRKHSLDQALSKWNAVLKWSFGLAETKTSTTANQ
jgi:N-acetylglucosaminyl-diphospho-decaprenol L-rhamnosyltransferase